MTSSTKRFPKLAQLRAFNGVAVAGAMTSAAGQLRLTQPAITRSIVALERELRVTLLQRTRRGSFLTGEGRVFGRRVNRAFEQINAALGLALGLSPTSDTVARVARKIGDPHVRCLVAIS